MLLVLYISERKSDYYNKLAQKFINPSTGSKTHWSILKTFINGKKIPLIPPLNVVNKLVADFKEKSRLFNEYFASKCTPISIDSSLPRLVVFNSESSLSAIHFNNDDILKISRSLNINKAHGHDNISIRMIKICDKAIVKPLSITYKNYTGTSIFPDIWKKCNIVPVYKKGDKQLLQNYRPVSLLPIIGKNFEKIFFQFNI